MVYRVPESILISKCNDVEIVKKINEVVHLN